MDDFYKLSIGSFIFSKVTNDLYITLGNAPGVIYILCLESMYTPPTFMVVILSKVVSKTKSVR